MLLGSARASLTQLTEASMRSSVRVLFVCLLVSLSVLTAPAQPGTTQVAVAQSFTSDLSLIHI